MAASSLNAVRVRLYFDYPPPGMPDCRMSWVLVDLHKCRVVADLCSVIREKFDYSRKTVLDLFIENCFLPPAESIHVVRDNDSIRVKVSGVSSEHLGKKRRRDDEELIPTPTKKNRHAATETNGFPQPAGKKKKKHKGKKKKREGQQDECRVNVKASVPAKESSSYKSQTDKSTKKASASSCLTNEKASSSSTGDKSSDSSDSSEKVNQIFSPNKSSRGAQVTASKRPAVRKFSFSEDKDQNVLVKKSPKSTTCTSVKTPKGSSVPPKSATNSTGVKDTQVESSSDLSSSQDEASAVARKANLPAKSVSVQQKSTTATSKAKPQTVTSSSSEDGESSTGRKTQVLPKSTSSSSKIVSSLQTQSTSSKISTSIKPSENSKTSKSQRSSDSSSSSEDEACDKSLPATPKPLKTAPALCAAMENGVTPIPSTPVGTMLQDEEEKAERADSSSSSDTELVIKKPNPQLMIGLTPRGRGRGFTDRVKGRGGVRGGFGRARGTPWKQNFHYSNDAEEQRPWKDIQTNQSLLMQNPPEPSSRRDYSSLPLLAAAPAVGQKIAFKLLELTENYTPEVSDYKEGKIISFNHSTNVIELELLTPSQARYEPGKFDLVYQDPDGSERVEYAVTFGSQLTERWESLLEPRLIVQNTD